MHIYCIEGNYGIGKSTLINKMQQLNVGFINEGFMELYSKEMDPNGVINEIEWISSWFKRVIELNRTATNRIVIADRSPYSALFFMKSCISEMKIIIDNMILELKNYDIHVITIHLKTQRGLNWDRVLKRLKYEPHRNVFSEDNREKFDLLYDKYNEFKWDHEVENDDASIENIIKLLINSAIFVTSGT